MSRLLSPEEVKRCYMRAIRVVHPDKHNTMDAAQRFIAEAIFHALETAYRVFEDSERGGGSSSGGATPTNVISSL
jgi:DnaJ-class molecular chaperone